MRKLPMLILAVFLTACGGGALEPAAEVPAAATVAAFLPTRDAAYPVPPAPANPADSYLAPALPTVDPYPAATNLENTMPTSPSTGRSIPITSGALGPLLEAVALDLSTALGIDVTDVQFISAESAIWPDGGLGCPSPDMMYTQVLVEGVLVRVQAGDVVTEYHTDGLNRFVRCQDGLPVSQGTVPRR